MSDKQRGICIHVPGDWLHDAGAVLPFYRRLCDGFDRLDVSWKFVEINRELAQNRVKSDNLFHIFNHGRISHPRVLNAGIAYVYPYWHLDPAGIRAFSSIADAPFQPRLIDGPTARRFMRKLRARLVGKRTSRYEQPQETEPLPQAAAAIFLQSESHRNVGETLYLDRWTMVETTSASTPRPVIVKPHPREMETALFDQLLKLQTRHPNLHIALGNIHDIIAASDRVVTINSAVGVEALLHEKPVILCGRTDFNHIATTVKTPDDLRRALEKPAPTVRYAKYLYWYFGQQCLDATAPDLAEQVLTRINAQGYHL